MPSTPPSCSYFVPNPPQPPGPTLNAITPAASDRAQRTARRIGKCERLSDLGLEFAEATQREGLRDLQAKPERVVPPNCYMPPRDPPTRSTILAEAFSILSRCVRQAILLEARLDSGAYDHPPAARATPAEPAPHKSPEPRTREPGDGTGLEYERLEDDLAADEHRPADEILFEICEKLGEALEKTLPVLSQAHPTMPRTHHHGVPPPTPAQHQNRPPDKPSKARTPPHTHGSTAKPP